MWLQPGKFWDGEAVGQEIEYKGIDAYISKPSNPGKKGVLFITDIFGKQAVSSQYE